MNRVMMVIVTPTRAIQFRANGRSSPFLARQKIVNPTANAVAINPTVNPMISLFV